MKKLITDKGTFGPFTSITITQDSYLVDGIVYPFAVIGSGVIVEWEGDIPTPPPIITKIVPPTLDPAQARLILLKYDLLDSIEELVAQAPRAIQILWNHSKTFRRNNEQLNQLWALAGRTQEELDDLFIEGDKL